MGGARRGDRLTAGTLVIALDGPAASGKGTLAKQLAGHFGLPHLDTGLLYRAVARGVLDRGGDPGDTAAAAAVAAALDAGALDEDRLRGAEMGEAASRVAAIPDGAGGAARPPARLRRPAGRGGARRARHRHGDLPGRHGEALRHRHARGAGRAALQGACRPRRERSRSPTCWPTSAGATRAIPAAAPRRWWRPPMRTCSIPPLWI